MQILSLSSAYWYIICIWLSTLGLLFYSKQNSCCWKVLDWQPRWIKSSHHPSIKRVGEEQLLTQGCAIIPQPGPAVRMPALSIFWACQLMYSGAMNMESLWIFYKDNLKSLKKAAGQIHMCYTHEGLQHLAGSRVTPKDRETVCTVGSSNPKWKPLHSWLRGLEVFAPFSTCTGIASWIQPCLQQ